jgi:hypothetical protein
MFMIGLVVFAGMLLLHKGIAVYGALQWRRFIPINRYLLYTDTRG